KGQIALPIDFDTGVGRPEVVALLTPAGLLSHPLARPAASPGKDGTMNPQNARFFSRFKFVLVVFLLSPPPREPGVSLEAIQPPDHRYRCSELRGDRPRDPGWLLQRSIRDQ